MGAPNAAGFTHSNAGVGAGAVDGLSSSGSDGSFGSGGQGGVDNGGGGGTVGTSLQSPEPVACQPAVKVPGLVPRLNHARSSVTSHF